MGEHERIYEVCEPMDAVNVFTVRARSREDAIQRVLDQDQDAILGCETPMPFPARRKWTVRWLREWPSDAGGRVEP